MDRMKISEDVAVGPQPSEAELQQLQQQGFRSIVNLRTEGEEDQPLSPQAEGEMVRTMGLEYVHIPVSTKDMQEEQVDLFRDSFQQLHKPVYVHCKAGKRAGAFTMMHIALQQGMSGEQTLKKAAEMGFECDQPELEQFVRQYVDSHSAAT